jgi:hypothetical protein
MRQAKALTRKITKLEKQAGFRGPMEIPAGVQTVYFFNQKQGQPPEEIAAEKAKKKAELVERYGNRILSRLHFITFVEVSSNREKPSLAP